MEQRKEADLQEVDVASIGVLMGVVAAAFITLGVIIYFFDDVRRQQLAGPDRADDAQQVRHARHDWSGW
jgi:hypothetical protein